MRGKTSSSAKKPAARQAIVLIHGIGDQQPMATLRGFVTAILGGNGQRSSASPSYFSLPDTLDETFELRRLMILQPRRTDFYELYWAHLMPTASTNRIKSWFWALMVRKFGDVPGRVSLIWLVSWLVLLAIVALGALSIFNYVVGSKQISILKSAPPTALLALLGLVWITARSYVGDAAVYLSPSPENIDARRKIRAAALSLLEKLNRDSRYDRIVVVGHSLGSVIGYDAIGLCWQAHLRQMIDTFYAELAKGSPARQSLARIREAEAMLHRAEDGDELDADAWHAMTRVVSGELASNGHPWKISDFITLGSPLSYGDFLLARGRSEFASRKQQREFPTSPPVLEGKGNAYHQNLEQPSVFTYDQSGRDPTGKWHKLTVPHHAAAFAATAWTNLYFPNRAIVWGDLIGGPLRPQFGAGVKDVAVKTSVWWGFFSHTSYWRQNRATAEGNSLVRLRALLDLDRGT